MRFAPCIAVILATAGSVRADKKIQGMTPGFAKEVAGCQIEVRGLARVVAGTTELAATLQGSERVAIDADLAALTAASSTVTSYCAEVEGLVKFLEDNAGAAYKSVEKDLDTRDNAVRKLRKDAKKALADIAPITRKLIPRIKRTPAPEPATAKAEETAFPSKRKVVLPKLGGTWAVSGSATSDVAIHTDKVGTASVTTRPFDKASCEHQRTAFAARSDTPAAELQVVPEAEKLGVAWSSRVATRKPVHGLLAMCVERGMGGVMVTADIVPADRKTLDAGLTKLMIAMLAVQLEARR